MFLDHLNLGHFLVVVLVIEQCCIDQQASTNKQNATENPDCHGCGGVRRGRSSDDGPKQVDQDKEQGDDQSHPSGNDVDGNEETDPTRCHDDAIVLGK